jgi:hypothetical protein
MCSVKKNPKNQVFLVNKIKKWCQTGGKDLGYPLVLPIWDYYQDNRSYEAFWFKRNKGKKFKMAAKKIAVTSSVRIKQSTKYNKYGSSQKQRNTKHYLNYSNIEFGVWQTHPELLSYWIRQINFWTKVQNFVYTELYLRLFEFYYGHNELYQGIIECYQGFNELLQTYKIKVLNLEHIELYNGLIKYYHGHNELYQGTIKYYHGHNELYQGIIKYYHGQNELSQGIIELYQIYNGLKKTRFQRIKRIMHRKRRKIRGGIDIDFSLSLRRITELNIEVQSIIEILMECKMYIKEYMVLLELKSVIGREVKTTQGCAILPGVAELQKHPKQIFIL